ncbi:MAG: TetR/AcrR family transcriptional regulator [Corynebacteriales bacterium]|nr:TetR/AcrR family transcriptional regulator [Mycobacteriales bacterium]
MPKRNNKEANDAVELLWGEPSGPKPGPKPALSLDRVVRSAIAVADEQGLTGLSMRKIAEPLGFTTMSLYRHVPGREQLIDLMCDAVLEECAELPPRGTWREQLERSARARWELHKRHPWLAQIRGTRRVPGPNSVAHYEHVLRILAETGLRPAQVIAAAALLGRFVEAEALAGLEAVRAEQSSGLSEEEWWGERGTLFARMDRYPTLSALWRAGGFDRPEDSFEFGLARVLDGIEVLIERDEIRDEIAKCEVCGGPVERSHSGRPRAYCSRACQQRAYRRRKAR